MFGSVGIEIESIKGNHQTDTQGDARRKNKKTKNRGEKAKQLVEYQTQHLGRSDGGGGSF